MKTAIEYFKENFDQSAAEKLLDFALNGYASEQTLRILEKGLVAFCDTENDAYAAALWQEVRYFGIGLFVWCIPR